MARDSYLNRDTILEGNMRRIAEAKPGLVRLMTDAERDAWVQRMIDTAPSMDEVWVFGYGSLIWNPAFHFAEKLSGRIHGYHRSFCMWTKLGRGCDENPGLMLGLERGGSSTGVAYRIDASQVHTELDILFRRELLSYAYIPTWVSFASGNRRIQAITMVMDQNHERYCTGQNEETVVRHISTAIGPLGRNCDYLFDLVDHLDELGFNDRKLKTLAKNVRAYQGANNITLEPPES